MMDRFTAEDLQRNPSPVQQAAVRAPVAITDRGRDRFVMMSTDEYERLKRRDRQAFRIEDLPEEYVELLGQPYSNPEQDALNHLLDE